MQQLKQVTTRYLCAGVAALLCAVVLGMTCYAQEPQPAPVATSAQPAAPVKVMRDYKGVKLGMKREEVRALMGKTELKEKDKDRFIIKGDDRLTVYYDNDQAKAVQLYIVDAKNAPAWADVVGNAPVEQMENGAKRARRDVLEEKFWVSMYQSKDGALTTITISR